MSNSVKPATARVIANYGAELVLADESGTVLTGIASKKLGLIVCGDLVGYDIPDTASQQPPPSADQPLPEQKQTQPVRVTELKPRSGTLARTDRRGQAKPIAANVTQLVVVTAPKPPFDPLLIDRYSVAANHIKVKMVIVINKTDLLDDKSGEQATLIEQTYSDIGYQVIRCSSKQDHGMDSIIDVLEGQVSILVGQSGVGKSSLLNQLLPDTRTRTGALSEVSGLGRHTTTVTSWYNLPSGGAIIDSAGVRQFALDHLSGIDIQAGFTEISELSERCKFNDCIHLHEPECAVLEALQSRQLSQQRYNHFLAMRQNDSQK